MKNKSAAGGIRHWPPPCPGQLSHQPFICPSHPAVVPAATGQGEHRFDQSDMSGELVLVVVLCVEAAHWIERRTSCVILEATKFGHRALPSLAMIARIAIAAPAASRWFDRIFPSASGNPSPRVRLAVRGRRAMPRLLGTLTSAPSPRWLDSAPSLL